MKEDQRLSHERIVADPRILAGKPVAKGTRIPVDLVLEELAQNPDIAELLAAHPDLTRTDVQACLAYARAIANGDQSALSAALKSSKVQVKKQKKWAGGDRGIISFPLLDHASACPLRGRTRLSQTTIPKYHRQMEAEDAGKCGK